MAGFSQFAAIRSLGTTATVRRQSDPNFFDPILFVSSPSPCSLPPRTPTPPVHPTPHAPTPLRPLLSTSPLAPETHAAQLLSTSCRPDSSRTTSCPFHVASPLGLSHRPGPVASSNSSPVPRLASKSLGTRNSPHSSESPHHVAHSSRSLSPRTHHVCRPLLRLPR